MGVKPATIIGSFALLALALGASCGDSERPDTPTVPAAPDRPTADLRLLVITDLKGYLEPCGCTSRPLGGIDRMAARVESLSEGVPTAVVAAGDLFFDGLDHGGVSAEGADAQELWKAETLVGTFNGMGVAAITPGRLDFSHGVAVFEQLEERADFPFLAAGLTWTAESPEPAGAADEEPNPPASQSAEPGVIIERGELKLGVLGVSVLDDPVGPVPTGVTQPADPIEAAKAAAASLREQGADIVVALVRGGRRLSRRLSSEIPEIDFIVQAGLDENDPILPAEAANGYLFHAGRQGQGLLAIDVYRRGSGDYTNWSDWTLNEERSHLEDQIEALERRIAEWESDDSVNAADLRTQRQRLARMQREHSALRLPQTVEGNAFNAQYFELGPDASRKRSVTQAMQRYDRRVNQHNSEVFANLVPEPAAEGEPHFVGSESCRSCHQEAAQWWSGHAHGIAYQTLVDRDKQFNLSCVGCHVTGYMQPGGSTVTHNLDGALVNVGCETCHGPGSAHVAEPESDAGHLSADTAETVCVTCHNPEHSDTFVYAAYRAMLVVPGHGLPAAE